MEEFKMEEYMPPTTKIPFHNNKKYHVFLSFRGKDVRKTLVDHLFEALTTAGLHVFLDSEKIEKGEIIGLTLERAIESSTIRIPIFSRGYADSTWCLRETTTISSTPGLIIPLFYGVDPSDVRYPLKESSHYRQAFLKHYANSDRYPRRAIECWKCALQQICPCLQFHTHSVRFQGEKIDEWKDALMRICSFSGWSLDITEGYEAQLVKRVVKDVIKTLDRVPLEVAKHPVGMESLTQDLIHKFMLNSDKGVLKSGIVGIGGIGKTTLAKVLYNLVYAQFDAASFVFNVRATAAEPMGLTNMQKQILEDLINYDGKVRSIEKGKSLLRNRLGGERVLLILDDVDSREQSNALIGDWLAPGSRVIITSRDKHILSLAEVSSEYIHEMSGLQINEGLKLFSWHAFLKESPRPDYENLSKEIVEACKGHPLSLEVIGSLLYDKQDEPDCWREAVHNITLHQDIHERLKISYNALTKEEKEIFLDIACFFLGEHKTYPIVFWNSLYKKVTIAISNLSMKLLIKIDDKGVFNMHDHLRDMGRTITEKEMEGRRLWKAAQLSTISNGINLSHLQINGGASQRLETLCQPGLRFLCLQNLLVEGITEDTLAMLPPSLIWLRLEKCNFEIQKPLHFRVGNNWQLRIMQVNVDTSNFFQYSLSNIIGNLSQLQHLDLKGCTNLSVLPDAIGNLLKIQKLELRGCRQLINLPDTIGNLSNLQELELRGCTQLNSLPVTIGNLSQLKRLDLGGCTNLNNLLNSIANLSQLQHLDLRGCIELNYLTNSIGNHLQLQSLDLGGCKVLDYLSDTIGNLSQLQNLYFGGCKVLINLPNTIGNLSQLQHLHLGRCVKLNNLPDTIGNLSMLQTLNLRKCKMLKSLPSTIGNLSQLQNLNLRECILLNKLPDTIGNLSQLKHLNLRGCIKLKSLPSTIDNLSHLQQLNLKGTKLKLKNLPHRIVNSIAIK